MKKLSFKSKVAKSLELPDEYVSNRTKISITDFSVTEIINYKNIIEYAGNSLVINTEEKIIKISGCNLNIENITDDEIKITGTINGITFE